MLWETMPSSTGAAGALAAASRARMAAESSSEAKPSAGPWAELLAKFATSLFGPGTVAPLAVGDVIGALGIPGSGGTEGVAGSLGTSAATGRVSFMGVVMLAGVFHIQDGGR